MLHNPARIVIVGATSSIAEHCARLWVAGRNVELILIGRDLARTERVAADLRVRSTGSTISAMTADFIDPRGIATLVDALAAQGPLHQVLIAHGSLPDQARCQQDLVECNEALSVNGVSPVLFAEAFAGHMERANQGVLTIIGSVAGDRGRRSNYVYGAAKGLVTRYAQGLQHRLAGSGSAFRVVLVKPGPTATPMTAHLPPRGLASPESVARMIVNGSTAGKPVIYAPGKWALIMMVIRHLPAVVFNKMNI